jgi:YfiH family protein
LSGIQLKVYKMFKRLKSSGIEYYISDLMPENLHHAFTTRVGGEAPGPLSSFSMGTAQFKEYISCVETNRKSICELLDIDFDTLVMTDQRHTDHIVMVESVKQANSNRYILDTDAVIIASKDIAAMLFFADCTPVMLYDPSKELLGLVHAGWRGTEKRIAAKTAFKMINEFGCSPANILVAIGPAIGRCCYEVSQDVAKSVLQTVPQALISDTIIDEKSAPFIDLKEINAAQLKALGIEKIDILNKCTACNPQLFYSHRATGGQTGRHAMIARIF